MPTRRLTPRGAERRAQLIAGATRLFAAKGYHPTSVADIVDALGVGKGVFYWYFESKEQLFVEILRDAQKDMRRRQRDAIAEVGDPVQRVAEGVRAAVRWSAEHPDLFRLFAFAQTDDTFAAAVHAGRATLVGDAVTHIKEAIAEGRIPDRDPEQLAWAIVGVSSTLTEEFVHLRQQSAEDIADAVAAFCLGGLGAG